MGAPRLQLGRWPCHLLVLLIILLLVGCGNRVGRGDRKHEIGNGLRRKNHLVYGTKISRSRAARYLRGLRGYHTLQAMKLSPN